MVMTAPVYPDIERPTMPTEYSPAMKSILVLRTTVVAINIVLTWDPIPSPAVAVSTTISAQTEELVLARLVTSLLPYKEPSFLVQKLDLAILTTAVVNKYVSTRGRTISSASAV